MEQHTGIVDGSHPVVVVVVELTPQLTMVVVHLKAVVQAVFSQGLHLMLRNIPVAVVGVLAGIIVQVSVVTVVPV